jgi:hypothetical protein
VIGAVSQVSVAAMSHPVDADDTNFVGDVVEYPIIADTDASVVRGAGELLRALGPGIGGEGNDGSNNPVMDIGGQPTELSLGSALDEDRISGLFHGRRGIRSAGGRIGALCGLS